MLSASLSRVSAARQFCADSAFRGLVAQRVPLLLRQPFGIGSSGGRRRLVTAAFAPPGSSAGSVRVGGLHWQLHRQLRPLCRSIRLTHRKHTPVPLASPAPESCVSLPDAHIGRSGSPPPAPISDCRSRRTRKISTDRAAGVVAQAA